MPITRDPRKPPLQPPEPLLQPPEPLLQPPEPLLRLIEPTTTGAEKWKRRDEGQQVPLRGTEPPPSQEDLKSLVVSGTQGHMLPLRRRNTGTPIVTEAAATMNEIQGAEKTIRIAPTGIPSISHPTAHLAQLVETTVRPPPDLPVSILVILPETLLVSLPATIPGGTANPAVVSQRRGHPVSQNHDLSLQKENPLIQSLKSSRNRKTNWNVTWVLPDHVTRLLTGESELPDSCT